MWANGEGKMNGPTIRSNRISTMCAAFLIMAGLTISGSSLSAGEIADHPDELEFDELKYTPPKPADYRYTLKCGATAYVAENSELPTFQLTILIRTGSIYEPREKAGVAAMTGHLMRNGGVKGMSVAELDERLAMLASELSVTIGESQGSARLFCLSKDADEALDLLRNVLRTPEFDQAALDRHRTDLLSEMKQRNASTSSIETREWRLLMYGDHPRAIPMRRTEQSVESITRADLLAFHEAYFFPKNFIFAASSDLKVKEVVKKLNNLLDGWPDRQLDLPEIPDQVPSPKPGVYMIKKDDVNQSRISVGHLGAKRDIPEQFALQVMNHILGGGFTSRITRRVRSDEGLAYSTGSRFDRPVLYPGTFRAWFQTKHTTGAFGTRLIVDEIQRIRTEVCDEGIVENSKTNFVSRVVDFFNSKNRIVNTFADDEYTGRGDNYWENYTKNIEAVTPDDVLAVAQKYLHPEKLVFLVVGDPEAVLEGSEKHADRFSDFGEITVLPSRDPMTLEFNE